MKPLKFFILIMFIALFGGSLSSAMASQEPDAEFTVDGGSITVTINPRPAYTKKDTTIYAGSDINLQLLIKNLSANAIVKFYSDRSGQNEINNTLSPAETTKYYFYATNTQTNCSSEIDSLVVFIIINEPSIVSISPTIELCEGEPLYLEVEAVGENIKYQWYLNGEEITGATSSTYFVDSANRSAHGSYTIKVWNDYTGNFVTAEVFVKIRWDGILVVKFYDVILVDNHKGLFIAYQWYRDGKKLIGETKQFLEEKGGLNGLYYTEITLTDGTKITTCDTLINRTNKSLSVKLYPNPAISSQEVTLKIEGILLSDEIVRAEIFNTIGQLFGVHELKNSENKLKINATSGTYLFRITLPTGEVKIEKLIVK